MQESILRFFQTLHTPGLDKFFTYVTMLGEQYFIILVVSFIYWNYSKKQGFILTFLFIISSMVNVLAKAIFHTQRPFHKMKDLDAIRVHTAEGHSFPSGHTQGATTLFVGVAKIFKGWKLMVFAIAISCLVAVSRMYLGVHWPIDVIGGFAFACIIVFLLYGYLDWLYEYKKAFHRFILIIMVSFYMILLAMILMNNYYWDDPVELKSFYRLIGVSTGAILAFIFEEKKYPFAIDAPRSIKYLRYVIGLGGAVGILAGLKLLLPENAFGILTRYFLVGAWISGLFPILGQKLKLFKGE